MLGNWVIRQLLRTKTHGPFKPEKGVTRNEKVHLTMILQDTEQFKTLLTDDGSPTMRLAPTWEPMHALDGGFTETIYIYQPTAQKAFEAVENPRFFSMGLGLGYCEMLTAFEALKQGKTSCEIFSYEKIDFLIDYFGSWVDGVPTPIDDLYDLILDIFSKQFDIPGEKARAFLRNLRAQNLLHLLGPYSPEVDIPACHAIYFDAFSKKTSPELWDETLLKDFFKGMATPCFFSSYASKGPLRRALKENGFEITIIKGFGKKRESTFAARV